MTYAELDRMLQKVLWPKHQVIVRTFSGGSGSGLLYIQASTPDGRPYVFTDEDCTAIQQALLVDLDYGISRSRGSGHDGAVFVGRNWVGVNLSEVDSVVR